MIQRARTQDCAGALMKSMATVENGTKWMERSLPDRPEIRPGQDQQPAQGPSLRNSNARNKNVKYFFGTPCCIAAPGIAETYTR